MQFQQALEAYKTQDFNKVVQLLSPQNTVLTRDETSLKAEALQKLKRYEDAMNVWNIAIANFGDDAEFYAERGVCKFHLRFKSSIGDLNKAIDLDPKNGYRYACRAYVKDKIGDTEGAIEDYTIANELDPGNDITLNNLGLTEEKLGHTKRARANFKNADSIAGIAHITDKYFKESPETEVKPKKSISQELRKMLSSKAEFKTFWTDALKIMRIRK
ncbi:MAG: tetratricopeptide (TPR) repeat protein [Bacteroidia bacterium]|jgi:tetratricopeptide (TPR) repeat protein